MSETVVFKSPIGYRIEGFIAEKQSLGFKYIGEKETMRRFDRYWTEHGYGDTGLTEDNLAGWISKKDDEGGSGLRDRVSVIRQFSLYLNGLGIPSYFPGFTVRYKPRARQPFSSGEIGEFINLIDTPVICCDNWVQRKRFYDEYPMLFRLLYLNGMRISEACGLEISQVNFTDATITVYDGKGHKDRLIYMADDVALLLKDYVHHMKKVYALDSRFVFPGKDPERHIMPLSVNRRFNEVWAKTSFAGSREKPSVHDFRHTYVVNRINLWMEQGLDFDHMLPYLCKYLGHRNFNETYYYYHYVEEAAKAIREKDSVIGKVIPEVMRR